MYWMTRFMDYMISPQPIRIVDLTVDKSKLLIQSLTIINVGHLPGRTLQKQGAAFQHWAIVYIAGGNGNYRVNGGMNQRVGKGSLFFFYPGAAFDFGPDENGHWDEYYFTIEGERIWEWMKSWPLQPGQVLQTNVELDELQRNRIDRIFMLMESGVPANADRASLLLETLLHEFVFEAGRLQESSRKQRAIQVIEDIASSVHQPVDDAELAARHHISIPTLRRIVSEYSGYPLHEYIHRLKAAEAKKMLLNSNLSLKEIADALGYADVFYFSRLFKKYVGESPRHYRRGLKAWRL